jgi:AbrB family looped-hinge helix DNA binding protein
MAFAHSKLTKQSQITIPAKVRVKLGIGPGSIVEWEEASGVISRRGAVKTDHR